MNDKTPETATENLTQKPSEIGCNDLFGVWQPIETAPEDGSEVLLYQPNAGMQVSWYGYDPDNEELGWYRFSPTHWMALPLLPNDQEHAPR